jgi:cytochrome c peroxidase
MRNRYACAGLFVAAAVAATCPAATPEGKSTRKTDFLRPAEPPAPEGNRPTAARVALGKALFFDPRLSGSNWISCATCHNPSLGWSDGLPTGIGHGMKTLGRATPTIINTAFNPLQMWDGRKATLEDQALGPIAADVEMAQEIEALVKKLDAIAGYRAMFAQAYPGEPISGATIGKAIASFERTVLSTESPFDRWVKGEESALDEPAKRGFDVFRGKGNCETCHSGFNFTDNGFHNIGVREKGTPDLGRFNERKVPLMRGAFKTPTLRDVSLTAPYMHNGAYRTLEEVIEMYARGGDVTDNLSPKIKPLDLSPRDKADLAAFVRSLTGAPMPVTLPQLPQ